MDDELLKYWEDRAAHHEREWEKVYRDNATLGPLIYWRDVVPYKHIVRAARLKADKPICWGASDCLKGPIKWCTAGKHEVCTEHAKDCFLCRTENESTES